MSLRDHLNTEDFKNSFTNAEEVINIPLCVTSFEINAAVTKQGGEFKAIKLTCLREDHTEEIVTTSASQPVAFFKGVRKFEEENPDEQTLPEWIMFVKEKSKSSARMVLLVKYADDMTEPREFVAQFPF